VAITLPFTFTPQTVADATQVNANFNAVTNALGPLGPNGSVLASNGTVAAYTRDLTNLHSVIVNSDPGIPAGLIVSSLAASAGVYLARANGTAAANTPIVSGDILGVFQAAGWDGAATNFGGYCQLVAAENWTTAARGTYFNFWNVIPGTTAVRSAMSLHAGVLIGTPVGGDLGQGTLNVAGVVQATGFNTTGANAGLNFTDRSTALAWQLFATGGVGSLWNATAGNVINVTVAGACSNISGTWSAISDRRLKQNVARYAPGLDAVRRLEPVTFQFNGKGGLPADGTTHYGLIADDVAEIMPELVGEFSAPLNKDDTEPTVFKTIDPGRAIYAVINAIRELEARLAALEAGRGT
jgi:hypothetical protein